MSRFVPVLPLSNAPKVDVESPRGEITREFFRIVAENPDEYELVISPMVRAEIDDSSGERQKKPKRRQTLLDLVKRAGQTVLLGSLVFGAIMCGTAEAEITAQYKNAYNTNEQRIANRVLQYWSE